MSDDKQLYIVTVRSMKSTAYASILVVDFRDWCN